jgi:protein SCO1/2
VNRVLSRAGRYRWFLIPVFLWAALSGSAWAHKTQSTADLKGVGIDEKLGKKVPGDVVFLDEHGIKTTLGDFVDRPTLVLPVYYSCAQACAVMLGNLASALNGVPLAPGKEYRVIALSIDPEDTPASALRSKTTYMKILKKPFAGGDWKFLTGSPAAVRRVTDAAGYGFMKTGKNEFAHPNVMIVLARDRTIIRYLYGPLFLSFDMGMALTEAARGTPSLSIRKVLSYCFSYDPRSRTYTFRAVQFIVGGIVLVMGVGLFFLLRRKQG